MHDAGPELRRHFGLLQATALNVTMIVGAGVFITIPFMLLKIPGHYAVLGWVLGGVLMLMDGLIWSELAAAFPGSGGSYVYLLETYGRDRWGRLMAFLFIWQFLISGPLEVASGLIAIAQFSNALSPEFQQFNEEWTWKFALGQWAHGKSLTLLVDPSRLLAFAIGLGILVLLYRRITTLGRLAVTFWVGVLGVIAWILVVGLWRFDPAVAFAPVPPGLMPETGFFHALGGVMLLAMYSYLGYYNVCYVGDEVRDPARTIPRAILLSAVLVCTLFIGLHFAMMGTVPWTTVPRNLDELGTYSLPAEFMRLAQGDWAVKVVTLLLIWSCFGSAFAALLGYSRIPYAAARQGHFFAALGKVHPVHHIPHISLLLVGGLTLLWSFLDLQDVINALITTRIIEQFLGQVLGVVLLRRLRPDHPRPFRMWLYPLPCLLAFAGWTWVYVTTDPPFIILGLATLGVGVAVFTAWAWVSETWPFARMKEKS